MRKKVAVALAVLVIAAAIDLRRPPSAQWSTRAALFGIHAYQATLSPIYDRLGLQCRFTPTCSVYGEAVVKRFGVLRGGWMATKRIFKCGPWTPTGTIDLPPPGSLTTGLGTRTAERDRPGVRSHSAVKSSSPH